MSDIDWNQTAAVITAVATAGMFVAVMIEKVIRPIGYWLWPEQRIKSQTKYRIRAIRRKQEKELRAEVSADFPNIKYEEIPDLMQKFLTEENERRKV